MCIRDLTEFKYFGHVVVIFSSSGGRQNISVHVDIEPIFDHLTITCHYDLSFLLVEEKSAFLSNQFPFIKIASCLTRYIKLASLRRLRTYNLCTIFAVFLK